VLLATLGLLISAPVLAVLCLALLLSAGPPVFYRGARVGRGGQVFTILKLRTMRVDAEQHIGERLAQPGEAIHTSLGGVLRRLRLDELPQLLNVLAGHMALVGPRPSRPVFLETHLREIPGYARRHSVRPGITGLAQVRGHYYTSPRNKLRYELIHLRNRSLALDVWILWATLRLSLGLAAGRPPRSRSPRRDSRRGQSASTH
jgi:lipopolysaccharide/colanic/teichoic acid biosynthesis glycosyltransferase